MQTLTDVFSDKANKAFHSIFADFLPTSADGVITFTVRGYGGKTACMTVPSGTPVFVFGTEELADFHRFAVAGEFYIVDHGGFRTLNQQVERGRVPVIYDIL
ncbi:TPA: hypothetical protein MYP50_004428 [Citrobacter freundii]|nr:hypothetical protein [Citrobacter freundii]